MHLNRSLSTNFPAKVLNSTSKLFRLAQRFIQTQNIKTAKSAFDELKKNQKVTQGQKHTWPCLLFFEKAKCLSIPFDEVFEKAICGLRFLSKVLTKKGHIRVRSND